MSRDADARPRVLIVDDEEPVLLMGAEYFQLQGCDVDCARELEEAQALLSFKGYELVIADLRLTGFGGVEGLTIIDDIRERCPWTRIILWTAYGTPEVEAEARRRGVDAFLLKPQPLPRVAQIGFGLLGLAAPALRGGGKADA